MLTSWTLINSFVQQLKDSLLSSSELFRLFLKIGLMAFRRAIVISKLLLSFFTILSSFSESLVRYHSGGSMKLNACNLLPCTRVPLTYLETLLSVWCDPRPPWSQVACKLTSPSPFPPHSISHPPTVSPIQLCSLLRRHHDTDFT